MSTLSVSNILSANESNPLTFMTGNNSASAIVITGNNVQLVANSTTVSSTNSTSVIVGGNQILPLKPYGNQISVSGTLILSGNVSPANLTSNTSAWNPDSSDIAYTIRVQASTNNVSGNANTYEAFISGMSAGTNGQIYTIQNIGNQKINFRTEDSVNETTDANRFNFPNHISLGGYMSMEVYYDGSLQRWRMVDSINIPFDYKTRLTKGFFAGGETPTTVITADKTTYSTETTSVAYDAHIGINFPRTKVGSVGGLSRGYIVGGYSAPFTYADIERVSYDSETTGAVASLTQARSSVRGAGNADKGFMLGGDSTTTPVVTATTTAEKITYSSESVSTVSGAALVVAKYGGAAAGNADKGFYEGGATPTVLATIERTTYSTETTAAISATISQARFGLAAAGNIDKGFFAGGQNPVGVATTDKTTYASETSAAVSGANLSQARAYLASAGNADKAFFVGGLTAVTTADRTPYASETTAAVTGANLSQGRAGLAGV